MKKTVRKLLLSMLYMALLSACGSGGEQSRGKVWDQYDYILKHYPEGVVHQDNDVYYRSPTISYGTSCVSVDPRTGRCE